MIKDKIWAILIFELRQNPDRVLNPVRVVPTYSK